MTTANRLAPFLAPSFRGHRPADATATRLDPATATARRLDQDHGHEQAQPDPAADPGASPFEFETDLGGPDGDELDCYECRCVRCCQPISGPVLGLVTIERRTATGNNWPRQLELCATCLHDVTDFALRRPDPSQTTRPAV